MSNGNDTQREFHLGDILSITTGKLLAPFGMDGVYDILDFMCNTNLYTHQLVRASDKCIPYIFQQHPQLAKIDMSDFTGANWFAWLQKQINKYGKTLVIKRISSM